jgi:hypothetical protein
MVSSIDNTVSSSHRFIFGDDYCCVMGPVEMNDHISSRQRKIHISIYFIGPIRNRNMLSSQVDTNKNDRMAGLFYAGVSHGQNPTLSFSLGRYRWLPTGGVDGELLFTGPTGPQAVWHVSM